MIEKILRVAQNDKVGEGEILHFVQNDRGGVKSLPPRGKVDAERTDEGNCMERNPSSVTA